MQEAIDNLSAAIDKVRPHLDSLAAIESKIESAQSSLETIEAQITLRKGALESIYKEIEDKQAKADQIHRDEIEARQRDLKKLVEDIGLAKEELKSLQSATDHEHTRWQDLLRKANKLEASLG